MPIAEDLSSLLPLFPDETESAIRLRVNAWANEGVSVEDAEEWVDTREGSFFFINTEPYVRELARGYDLMGTEYVAAGFALYSWGTYLDDLAAGYTLERLAATHSDGEVTFFAPEGTVIVPGVLIGVPAAVEGAGFKEYEVTEGGVVGVSEEITLSVTSVEAGSATKAAAGQLTVILSSIEVEGEGEVTVANADPIVGGTDPETDEALRERLLAVFEGRGPGNVRDYEVWSRSFGGVGLVTVIPVWNGPGTVKVIVLTADGQPVSAEVVEGLKAFLDPVAGKGGGQAPVGHTVTVETASAIDVGVTATIEFADGYSLEGTAGTIALEEALIAAVQDYFASVQSGEEVVLQKVSARLAAFDGVHDIKLVELNGAAANIVLDSNPAEIASLDLEATVLTEGTV